MKNLAIIPARSGSKGLKNKNIKLLNGKPLIAYTIEAAMESGKFDEVIVSTESKEYASVAQKFGAKIPFLRDKDLAGDDSSIWEVLRNVLHNSPLNGIAFDTVTLLQPTSPLRSSSDIIKAFSLMNEKEAEAIVSVCLMDHSPLWSNTLPEDNSMKGFIDTKVLKSRRQSLSKYYRLNGAIYLLKTDFLTKAENIYTEKTYALIMDRERSVDIDTILDFKFAEFLINNTWFYSYK